MARALAEGLAAEAEVEAPDLPVSPEAAMSITLDVCDRVQPDLVVGSSYGAFLGQQLVKVVGCPALLCSPMLHMSDYVSRRLGVHTYKSARRDGAVSYEVTPAVVDEFRRMEARRFDCYDEFYRDRVWGFYGSKDTLADTRDEFGRYYSTVIDYDGPHTMLRDNVLQTLVPAARRILDLYPCAPSRTFVHTRAIATGCCVVPVRARLSSAWLSIRRCTAIDCAGCGPSVCSLNELSLPTAATSRVCRVHA